MPDALGAPDVQPNADGYERHVVYPPRGVVFESPEHGLVNGLQLTLVVGRDAEERRCLIPETGYIPRDAAELRAIQHVARGLGLRVVPVGENPNDPAFDPQTISRAEELATRRQREEYEAEGTKLALRLHAMFGAPRTPEQAQCHLRVVGEATRVRTGRKSPIAARATVRRMLPPDFSAGAERMLTRLCAPAPARSAAAPGNRSRSANGGRPRGTRSRRSRRQRPPSGRRSAASGESDPPLSTVYRGVRLRSGGWA